ncbi:hypothetical protein CHGG_07213 [Chaetomium globosum CBS 148.51]|uniref:CWH43-like N-terminal domain-containing protein n=1 Tax=Chaetomium globosum (strain ATCC 6205 / CBS 148.51 / DSM 1962 / NBRC 6347 / NRRL 1970) TaxID=306901 RepID=Q2GXU1_CHAGB|nr:uncharacterized protein CHGG_07213 [Chaetomium globosum CBS 148.51]EAQ85960.1 hypothetical protein CHGG_07213 [Chaetomium globosum CBS 148.51]
MIRLSYWVTPILAGLVWLATLLALLLYWIVSENSVHYSSMSEFQRIAYISDIGASDLKPLITHPGYREHRILRLSFWIKLTFVIIEVLLAIAFVSCTFTRHYNAGAVLEWVIAFIFSAYVFSFYVDLYPAAATKHAPHPLRPGKQQHQEKQLSGGVGGGVPTAAAAPTMRLTRGDREALPRPYSAAGDMEEGASSEATLNGAAVAAPGNGASFEAVRVAQGRRSGSRSRALASNF